MKEPPIWSTACLDWEERIIQGRSLIPFPPLFPTEAAAALDIFRSLKLVDVAGRPTMGEVSRPWVLDFVAAIFGSYDAEIGRRLIQYYLLLISKKNSKSTTAAGIMVTALIRNWREEGEFFILAPTKEVADNSYNPARAMIKADPELSAILKPSAGRVIEHRNTGAFLKVIAADSETVSGKKAIGLLVDELWLFGMKAGAADLLLEAQGGLASHPEGFVVFLTTQSNKPPAGVFKQKLQEFRDIRDGKIIDPGSLPLLYEHPKKLIDSGAYRDSKTWYITNPNLGKSVDEQYLAAQLAKAERAGQAEVIGFFSKHLNVEIGLALRSDRWPGAEYWESRTDPSLTKEELLARSEVIIVGGDGGGLDDLLGFNLLGRDRDTKEWLCWSHGWCHRGVLERRKSIASVLEDFEKAGELTIVDDDPLVDELSIVMRDASQRAKEAGEKDWLPDDKAEVLRLRGMIKARGFPADIAALVAIVQQVKDLGLLAEVAVDPAGLGLIVDALDQIGITQENELLVGVSQGYHLMNAIKTAERRLQNGTLWHCPSRLMAWCVSNVKIEPTATAIRATKQNAGDAKIDLWAAMINSVDRMGLNPEAQGLSGWETDDLDALMAKIDAAAMA